MTPLVLDASAGIEILLGTPPGDALAAQMPRASDVWVPAHYYLEVASGLRKIERRGAVSQPKVATAVARLQASRVLRVSLHLLLHGAWAARGHLTIGDAFYVVLAQDLGATLVTADKRLAGSPGLRVPTITP